MRFPLLPIATLAMLIICNSKVLATATNFNNQNRSANNSNFTNVNFTNHSLLAQEPIFRRHLLNGTDTNITHTNSTDACKGNSCIDDKDSLHWVYVGVGIGVGVAVGAAALIFGTKYIRDQKRLQDARDELDAAEAVKLLMSDDFRYHPNRPFPGQSGNSINALNEVQIHALAPPAQLTTVLHTLSPPKITMQAHLSPQDKPENPSDSGRISDEDFARLLENPPVHDYSKLPPQPTRPAPALQIITSASTGGLPTSSEKNPLQKQR